MRNSLPATLAAIRHLLQRVHASRGKSALSVLLLLIGGAFEGATVGLLVPLLSMLTGLTSATPGGLQAGFDRLLSSLAPEVRVLALGGGILGLVALKNAVSLAGVTMAGRVRASAAIELRRLLLESILRSPPAMLERHTSGEITTVFMSEAWRVNRILDLAISFVYRGIIAASYLSALLLLSWQLTLVTMVLGVVLAFASQAIGRRALRFGRELTQASGRLARHVSETVGGLRVVRTTAGEDRCQVAFEPSNRGHAEADLGASLSQSMTSGVIETLGIAGAMGLIAIAYQVWLAPGKLEPGKLDVPAFLAFGFGLIRLLPALNQVYVSQAYITPLMASLEEVNRWLDLPVYPTRPFGSETLTKLEQGIRFENVSFSYDNGTSALAELSFFLPRGETLAVLGASGSGKSTLASLLLRLREPKSGRVLFDDREHWDFEPKSFARRVAFVEQDPFLFNESIADNVICGASGVGRAEVLAALDVVKLSEFVQRLPQGIDTVVAERGATISGGQRQRLAIARAIVRDPLILVLDEPTSALDPVTEQEVVNAIDAASVGRTTIIITHRLSTVGHATRRLNLAEGRIEPETPPGAGGPGLEPRLVASAGRE